EYQFDKPYSEKTAQLIDEEISALIEGQYTRAKQILRDNQDKLTALAEELLKHEVIFKENLETIFGKRPWLTSEEKVQAALDQAKPETDSTEDMDNALTESVVEAPLAEEALEGDSASDMADSAVENSDEENLESPQGNA
ncbi:MAG: hypothetical protein ACO39W_01560, partial [Schleiferiaceae bacterium]